jgi:parvulin-like peptidyl-prolyl isomerase
MTRSCVTRGLASFLLASFLALPAFAQQAPAQPAPVGTTLDLAKLPDVVAKVNGIEIKKSELMTQAAIVRAQIRRAGGRDPGANTELFKRILNGLIGEALIFDDAKKKGLLATDAEVDAKLAGFKGAFEDEAAFEANLKAQSTSIEQVRAQLRQSLSIEKALRAEMNQEAKVAETEMRAFYDQNPAAFTGQPEVKIRLVRANIEAPGDGLAREKARQKVESARRKLLEGTNFAEVVKQYSDDPLTKDKGGELPAFPLGSGPVDAAIAKLTPHQISQVIEFGGGFQVVELMEKLPARKITFEEAKPKIAGLLEQGKLQEAVLAKVEALRRAAKVETAF